ncbi:hypothetical protein PGT21_031554 [Puccinia graminis f. sp. tritici]|uniref:Uncharacterized protein n=1 Tax=Puccinia graminis f. sp. tritici TaxID=56615 RepID=A0A5B0QCD4_PUCGR|nr:hypothetical protein PGT21_031554 [Puccinia graminis f. sp. tritici]
MSGLEDMDGREALAADQILHQAAFAANTFERFGQLDFASRCDLVADLSIDRLRSKKFLLIKLRSGLLPQLRQHIISLKQALWHPNSVLSNPTCILKFVIETQPKLEMTLDRILWIISDIIRGRIETTNQTNDQHFKEFKPYVLRGLESSIRNGLRSALNFFFDVCRQLARQVVFPGIKQTYTETSVDALLESIECVVRWSKGSELHYIYDQWKLGVQSFDYTLRTLLLGANPKNGFYSEPACKAAQKFIPLIKLSQLFFKKLTTDGVAKKDLPFCTEMSSQQLSSLERSAEEIERRISNLVFHLPRAFQDNEPFPVQDSIKQIKALMNEFQPCLLLAALYYIPRCTETNVCSSEISLKTWIVTWNTLFHQATHNAIEICESFETD